jgi:hypothetical protein
VGRAKPVEEVQGGHACVERGRIRDGGEIVGLLDYLAMPRTGATPTRRTATQTPSAGRP